MTDHSPDPNQAAGLHGQHGADDAGDPARPVEHTPARSGLLRRTAATAQNRRWVTLGAWFAALAALVAISGAAGGDYDADYTAADSDSRAARDLLDTRFPEAAGETVNIVARSIDGHIDAPGNRDQVENLITQLQDLAHVQSIASRYEPGGAAPGISPDGSTALTQIRLDVDRPSAMPTEDTQRIMNLVADAGSDSSVDFAVNGQVVADVQNGEGGPEGLGLAAALVILVLTFGSVIAAGLPVLVAIAGLAISSS